MNEAEEVANVAHAVEHNEPALVEHNKHTLNEVPTEVKLSQATEDGSFLLSFVWPLIRCTHN